METPASFRLTPDDPPPFKLHVPGGDGNLVLCCEHGGRTLPACLANRAPSREDMARHIAWDVGASATARLMSDRLGAPLALQPYSRLVIDSNRPRHAPDLAPAVSDGTGIPFNRSLNAVQIEMRWNAIHQPFHAEVDRLVAARRPRAFVAVHSFTPQLRGGEPRPMAVGLLVRRDPTLASVIAGALGGIAPDHQVAMNAPYRIEDDSDYTIPVHAETRGLPHVLIEIRNDLIADEAGVERWGSLISLALSEAVAALDHR